MTVVSPRTAVAQPGPVSDHACQTFPAVLLAISVFVFTAWLIMRGYQPWAIPSADAAAVSLSQGLTGLPRAFVGALRWAGKNL